MEVFSRLDKMNPAYWTCKFHWPSKSGFKSYNNYWLLPNKTFS